MLAQFLTNPGKPRDAGPHRSSEPRFRFADRRDIDANAANADGVEFGQFPVTGVVLVEIDNAAPDRGIELTHRIQHAGIIEAVGAGLNEDIAYETDTARQFKIKLHRFVRRLVTDVATVGVFLGRPEYMKMGIASVRRRLEGWLEPGIRIVLRYFVHD